MNKILPVDVIKAGVFALLEDDYLSKFKKKVTNKETYYFKKIKLKNGAMFTISYRKHFHYLSIRVSLPKLIYGTNCKTLFTCDIEKIISQINKVIHDEQIDINFAEFKVSEIELSHNYVCRKIEDKQSYIDIFNKREIKYKKNARYETSAVYKNKSARTTIYDKSEELQAHKANIKPNYRIDRILRVEHKIKKVILKKYINNLTVENVLKILDLEYIFLEKNIKIGLGLDILSKKNFWNSLKNLIFNKSKLSQNKIINFYFELNQYGESYVKEKYSKYICQTYKKIMLDQNISNLYFDKKTEIIDFNNLYKNNNIELVKQEIKALVLKYNLKKEFKIKNDYFEKPVVFKPLYLPCNFLRDIKYFDTS